MEKKYKLPREFAEKWVAALRSEEYIQGKGFLCTIRHAGGEEVYDITYCCIGVGGAICGISDEIMNSQGVFTTEFFTKHDLEKFNLPKEIVGDCGNDISKLTETQSAFLTELVNMNDGENGVDKKTFLEIADWIEENCEFV